MSHRDSPNSPLWDGDIDDVFFRATLDALLDFENLEGADNDNTNPNDLFSPNNTLSGSGNKHDHNQASLQEQQPQKGPGDVAKCLHLDNVRNDVSSCSHPNPQPPNLPTNSTLSTLRSMSQYDGGFTPTQKEQQVPTATDTTGALPQRKLDQGDTTTAKHAAQQILQNLSLSQHVITSLASIAPATSLAASSSPNIPMQAPPMRAAAAVAASRLANLPRIPVAVASALNTTISLPYGPRCLVTTAASKKRPLDAAASAISEDGNEQRRQDRNSREQQRSQQIAKQIANLRQVLLAAHIPVEKVDKYSVLVTVGDYIKKLREESALLDAEHGKLVETINETSKIVNEQP